MGRIVQLVVLAVVLYFLVTEGWPWLQRELGRTGAAPRVAAGSGGGEQGPCLSRASGAADTFGDGLSRFSSRPVDTGAWMTFAGRVQQRISEARAACGCSHPACSRAAQAMDELGSVVYTMDGYVRGSAESTANPAQAMERVYDLLNEARGL